MAEGRGVPLRFSVAVSFSIHFQCESFCSPTLTSSLSALQCGKALSCRSKSLYKVAGKKGEDFEHDWLSQR